MLKRAKLTILTTTTKARDDDKDDDNKMAALRSMIKNEDKDEAKVKKKEVK
jgi:hypothetical protein